MPTSSPALTSSELLKREMPAAIDAIRKAGVGPVDMQQSVIGPGMGVFSRHAKVLEDDDSAMSVKTALAVINRVWEEIENELDQAFDPETQVALAWFATYGFDARASGELITLTTAKNTSDRALFASGVFKDMKGKAGLTPREELPPGWSPATDKTLTTWECVQHTARVLNAPDGGGEAAAALVAQMGPKAEEARALAYRLFEIATNKGWAAEALVYNELAQEWTKLEDRAATLDDAGRARRPEPGHLLPSREPRDVDREGDAAAGPGRRCTTCAAASTPFVEARMEGRTARAGCTMPAALPAVGRTRALDEYGLLKTMIDNWRDVFDDAFGRNDKHKARNFTSMALEARNATSHLSIPLAGRRGAALPRRHALLAQGGEGAGGRGRRSQDALRRPAPLRIRSERTAAHGRRFAAAPRPRAPPCRSAPRRPPRSRPAPPRRSGPGSRWRCRIRTCSPTASRRRSSPPTCSRSMPATPSEDYASPENFFRITFLTEGLRRILTSSLQRLSRSGGDPVIGLQTAFGGGKTHTMLAVYHLAKTRDLALLEGVGPLAEKAGVTGWTRAEGGRVRRHLEGRRHLADPAGRAEGPHALGLHRLADCRAGWA